MDFRLIDAKIDNSEHCTVYYSVRTIKHARSQSIYQLMRRPKIENGSRRAEERKWEKAEKRIIHIV